MDQLSTKQACLFGSFSFKAVVLVRVLILLLTEGACVSLQRQYILGPKELPERTRPIYLNIIRDHCGLAWSHGVQAQMLHRRPDGLAPLTHYCQTLLKMGQNRNR